MRHVDISPVVGLALLLGAPQAAMAYDFSFAEDMVYWSPLNTTERKDVEGANNDTPPYCQINIDVSAVYMQVFCYFTDYSPRVWRENTDDDFFYMKDYLNTDKCYFRFYQGGKVMLVTGCQLGGTWTHERYWKTE